LLGIVVDDAAVGIHLVSRQTEWKKKKKRKEQEERHSERNVRNVRTARNGRLDVMLIGGGDG